MYGLRSIGTNLIYYSFHINVDQLLMWKNIAKNITIKPFFFILSLDQISLTVVKSGITQSVKKEGVDWMFDEFDASEWWEFSHQGRGDNDTLFGMRGMILSKQWYASVNTTQSKTKWSSVQAASRCLGPDH